jgi:hypothetical protein
VRRGTNILVVGSVPGSVPREQWRARAGRMRSDCDTIRSGKYRGGQAHPYRGSSQGYQGWDHRVWFRHQEEADSLGELVVEDHLRQERVQELSEPPVTRFLRPARSR